MVTLNRTANPASNVSHKSLRGPGFLGKGAATWRRNRYLKYLLWGVCQARYIAHDRYACALHALALLVAGTSCAPGSHFYRHGPSQVVPGVPYLLRLHDLRGVPGSFVFPSGPQ